MSIEVVYLTVVIIASTNSRIVTTAEVTHHFATASRAIGPEASITTSHRLKILVLRDSSRRMWLYRSPRASRSLVDHNIVLINLTYVDLVIVSCASRVKRRVHVCVFRQWQMRWHLLGLDCLASSTTLTAAPAALASEDWSFVVCKLVKANVFKVFGFSTEPLAPTFDREGILSPHRLERILHILFGSRCHFYLLLQNQ